MKNSKVRQLSRISKKGKTRNLGIVDYLMDGLGALKKLATEIMVSVRVLEKVTNSVLLQCHKSLASHETSNVLSRQAISGS